MLFARAALLGIAAAWIVWVGALAYPEVRDGAAQVLRFRKLAATHPPVIPARCPEVHGVSGAARCWLEVSRFEQLYPDIAEITDETASERVVLADGHALENRIESLEDTLSDAATLALVPPLIAAFGLWLWRRRRALAPLWRWVTAPASG